MGVHLESRQIEITPPQPFAFDHILTSLRTSAGTVLEVITGDGEYRRAVYLEGQPALITVCGEGDILSPRLSVSVTAERVDAAIEAAVLRTVGRVFAAIADVSGLDATFFRDPVLWETWQRCRGFRPIVLPDLFEAIAWAIIGQQITVAFASKCKRALTEQYGERLAIGGDEYLLFPKPQVIALLNEDDLRVLQFSRQKARYLLNLARQIVSGEFDVEALWSLTAEEASEQLQTLVGIGRWTAEYVLLRGLGHADSIPAGDVALQRAIGRAYYGRMATEAEVRTLAEAWAPWRGYAAACWWYTQRLDQLKKTQGQSLGSRFRLATGPSPESIYPG
jgi:DNA-3-methyladenine glycosylase II